MRERRLAVCERLQRNARIHEDLHAVRAHDTFLFSHSIRQKRRQVQILLAPEVHADFTTRDEIQTLLPVGAMIDAHRETRLGQMLVRELLPAAAPSEQRLGLVPRRILPPKSRRLEITGGEQHVRVRVVLVIEVQGDIRDHAPGDELALRKIPQQGDLLWGIELDRQADFDVRATWESLRRSTASAVFHRVRRSNTQAGAPSGARISVYATPCLWR